MLAEVQDTDNSVKTVVKYGSEHAAVAAESAFHPMDYPACCAPPSGNPISEPARCHNRRGCLGVGVERGAYPSVSGEHNRHEKGAKLLSGSSSLETHRGTSKKSPKTQPIGPLANASSLAFTARAPASGNKTECSVTPLYADNPGRSLLPAGGNPVRTRRGEIRSTVSSVQEPKSKLACPTSCNGWQPTNGVGARRPPSPDRFFFDSGLSKDPARPVPSRRIHENQSSRSPDRSGGGRCCMLNSAIVGADNYQGLCAKDRVTLWLLQIPVPVWLLTVPGLGEARGRRGCREHITEYSVPWTIWQVPRP